MIDDIKNFFLSNKGPRYWWYEYNQQLPLFFRFYTSEQLLCLKEWYIETDKLNENGEIGPAECNISLMSMLTGLIGGNPKGNNKILQLGHHCGYSSLMLGFIYQLINKPNSLYSVDIDNNLTNITQSWIDKAQLNNYVKLETNDSIHPNVIGNALEYFGEDKIDVLFIDSSHKYEHTKKELELYFPYLRKNGFIFLHDTSLQAQISANEKDTGVKLAFQEFCEAHKDEIEHININKNIYGVSLDDILYQDGCGLGIVQKI